MYRFSKSRSYSVGSGAGRDKRKAEFNDSEVVTVNANVPTEGVDKLAVTSNEDAGRVTDRRGEEEDDMASTKGFARLDIVSLDFLAYFTSLPHGIHGIHLVV